MCSTWAYSTDHLGLSVPLHWAQLTCLCFDHAYHPSASLFWACAAKFHHSFAKHSNKHLDFSSCAVSAQYHSMFFPSLPCAAEKEDKWNALYLTTVKLGGKWLSYWPLWSVCLCSALFSEVIPDWPLSWLKSWLYSVPVQHQQLRLRLWHCHCHCHELCLKDR